jgi:hypothetical protein
MSKRKKERKYIDINRYAKTSSKKHEAEIRKIFNVDAIEIKFQ